MIGVLFTIWKIYELWDYPERNELTEITGNVVNINLDVVEPEFMIDNSNDVFYLPAMYKSQLSNYSDSETTPSPISLKVIVESQSNKKSDGKRSFLIYEISTGIAMISYNELYRANVKVILKGLALGVGLILFGLIHFLKIRHKSSKK